MKTVIALILVLANASLSYGGPKDVNVLNSMLMAGASQMVVGDQAIAKISIVSCGANEVRARCNFETEIEADIDESTTVTDKMLVVGSSAKNLLQALIELGVPSYEVRNGVAVRAYEVICTQPFKVGSSADENETECKFK